MTKRYRHAWRFGVGLLTLSAAAVACQNPAPPRPDRDVSNTNTSTGAESAGASATITGCIAAAKGSPQSGLESPSGYILMNASWSQSGGAPDTSSAEPLRTPPGTPGISPDRVSGGGTGPGSDSPRRDVGGVGMTYLLDGGGVAAHAGEEVEVRGRLHHLGTAGTPTLVATSIRTISNRCGQ